MWSFISSNMLQLVNSQSKDSRNVRNTEGTTTIAVSKNFPNCKTDEEDTYEGYNDAPPGSTM